RRPHIPCRAGGRGRDRASGSALRTGRHHRLATATSTRPELPEKLLRMPGWHGVAPGTRRADDDARPFSQVSADKSQRQDLNPQPTAYKAVALPIELRWPTIEGYQNLDVLPHGTASGAKRPTRMRQDPTHAVRTLEAAPLIRPMCPRERRNLGKIPVKLTRADRRADERPRRGTHRLPRRR